MKNQQIYPVVYVASRASLPERGAMWRGLREQGANIISTWIDEDGEGETGDFSELWKRIEDEIQQCDHLVLYAEKDDFPLKGALVEVGMALSLGKRVMIVAPGVTLEPRSMRPVGSWASHPNVSFVDGVEQAVFDFKTPEDYLYWAVENGYIGLNIR